MATLPLASDSTAIADLLAELEPNIVPMEPSIWPLALGYWLALAVVVIALTGAGYGWRATARQRRVARRLKQLQQLQGSEQLVALHQLLRWCASQVAPEAAAYSEQAFARWLAQRSLGEPPAWLNAHYAGREVSIDWGEANKLMRKLLAGGRQ